MPRVFISHASADAPVAKLIVRQLLESGMAIPQDDIFYTSEPGKGVKSGHDFKSYIRERLEHAEVAIAILSPNYYASLFCVAELGAIWMLAKRVVPVLMPPFEYRDLKGVLEGTHVLRLDKRADLDVMRDELVELLGTKSRTPRWNDEADTFLRNLPAALEEVDPVAASAAPAAAPTARTGTRPPTRTAKSTSVVPRRAPPPPPARRTTARSEDEDEPEQFRALVSRMSTEVSKLPTILREALFHAMRREPYYPGEHVDWESLTKHAQRDDVSIDDDDGAVTLNQRSPRVTAAVEAVDELASWLEDASPDFESDYTTRNGEPPDIASRAFWERHVTRM